MSIDCYKEKAPFVATHIFSGNELKLDWDTENDITKFVIPTSYTEKELNWQSSEDDTSELVVNGWRFQDVDHNASFRMKSVCGDLWTKDNMEIYIINQSQYMAGGDCELAAVANDKDHLNQFLIDFKDILNPNITVKENQIVVCFL